MQYCPRCKKKYNNDAKFCMECGSPVELLKETDQDVLLPEISKEPGNRNEKKIIIIGVAILSIFIALIFGYKTFYRIERSNEEILYDIKQSDPAFYNYNLEDCSVNIYDRKTNKKNGYDSIWCTAEGSNKGIKYTGDYYLQYSYYDQGWMMDYCDISSYDYYLISEPDEKEIVDYVKNSKDTDITYSNYEKTDDKTLTYYFLEEATTSGGLMTVSGTVRAIVSWSLDDNQWLIDIKDREDEKVSMNEDQLLGKWQGEVGFGNFAMNMGIVNLEITEVSDDVIKYNYGITDESEEFFTNRSGQATMEYLGVKNSWSYGNNYFFESDDKLFSSGNNKYYLEVIAPEIGNTDGYSGLCLENPSMRVDELVKIDDDTTDNHAGSENYVQLNKNSDISKYDKLYTSCTKPIKFLDQWESMEDVVNNARPEMAADYEKFYSKYVELENKDGYIEVNEKIIDDIKALAKKRGYGDDWKEFLLYRDND